MHKCCTDVYGNTMPDDRWIESNGFTQMIELA